MTISFPDLRGSAGTNPLPMAVGQSLAPTEQIPVQKGIYRRVVKRALDVTAVLLAAPAVVLVVGILALVVMLDGANPFYSQLRIGRNGKRFRMWKLRSMVPDADARMVDYLEANPAAREEWDQTQKLKQDPRITRIGHLLRKSSLDELPQLWNVLRGDMSLVGPRPMMPSQQVLYPGVAYYALRPGLTGFWQITERNRSSFSARADFDTAYEQALSFKTDLTVLLKTVRVVLRATGY